MPLHLPSLLSAPHPVLCSVSHIPNAHRAVLYTAEFSRAFIVCLKTHKCKAGFGDEGAVHQGISIVFDLQYNILKTLFLLSRPGECEFRGMFWFQANKHVSPNGTVLSASQITNNNLEDLLILQAMLVETQRPKLEQEILYTALEEVRREKNFGTWCV